MIKFVVFDFDGVFTDGSVIFDNDNNIIKRYNVIDGVGIKSLKNKNIEIGCISGYKENQSQKNILEHLNIKYISMGSNDKLNILKSWIEELNITLEEVAFMGDDINDIELMNNVKLVGCPKNAHKDCLELAQFVSEKNGGEGCVREFCDYVFEINNIKLIVIIPTRKNSTRVLNKNTRKFHNTTLLNIVLNKIITLKNIYKIIVSSNCEETNKIVNKYPNIIYEKRDEKFCTSDCKPSEWNVEIANLVKKYKGTHVLFCHCVCPFILETTYKSIINNFYYYYNKYDTYILSSKINEFIWYNNEPINYKYGETMPCSQDLPDYLIPCWGAAISSVNSIINNKSLMGHNPYFIKINKIESIDIDTNDEFVVSELLYKNNLITEEKINIYNNNKLNNFEILDCTIRDGGYTNNWEFNDNFVIDLYNMISSCNYDYFEIGFRNSLKCEGKGKYYNISDKEIDYIYNKSENKCKIAIMVTIGRFKLSDFKDKKDTNISLIRILIHRENQSYNIKEAKICAEHLIDKGYEVCINLGNSEVLTIEEASIIDDFFKDIDIKCIYLADTFGSINEYDITKLKILFEHNKVGFHGHNNKNICLNNTINAINDGFLIVDTTFNSLGKNAGNCPTESLILTYFDIKYLEYILNIYTKYKEIYEGSLKNILYEISGIHNIHSDYMNELLDLDNSDLYKNILKLINYFKNNNNIRNNSSYDKKLIKNII